jgi:hypothetical protein
MEEQEQNRGEDKGGDKVPMEVRKTLGLVNLCWESLVISFYSLFHKSPPFILDIPFP